MKVTKIYCDICGAESEFTKPLNIPSLRTNEYNGEILKTVVPKSLEACHNCRCTIAEETDKLILLMKKERGDNNDDDGTAEF